ncbi:MAG: tripartite tricarboxylate transporter substrate binding protein [Betaproteobacteria bacterium]|nr:tripartite tricarboxylate transporter substrate binding protein [Betaproteobacteria bacterium]
MNQPLRIFSMLIAAALAAMPGVAPAQQKFPTKPIRLVVPFSPGGGTDTLARIIATKMSDNWGQSVVIENRTGAGGTIGAAIVAKGIADGGAGPARLGAWMRPGSDPERAMNCDHHTCLHGRIPLKGAPAPRSGTPPDGHTLLVSSPGFVVSAALHTNLAYDPLKDFAGVTQLGVSMNALVVNPTLGVKTLKDFIEYARARPGKIFFSSGGHGSSTHINAERFRLAAGLKPVHVAFKGSADAALEVVAGRVHYVITGLITVMQYIQDGKLVPLGVIAPARSALLPDVPTIAELLPGYKRDGSHVMLAPAGTPRPILNQISNEVRRIFELPDVKERLKNFDYFLAPTTPQELDKILRADIETFNEVVRLAGLRAK